MFQTVLGPLLFLLYVNDFSEKLEGENDVVQFADDTSIICKFEPNENNPQKIEKILEQTDKYLTENQLTLNAATNRQIPDRESTHFKCR